MISVRGSVSAGRRRGRLVSWNDLLIVTQQPVRDLDHSADFELLHRPDERCEPLTELA